MKIKINLSQKLNRVSKAARLGRNEIASGETSLRGCSRKRHKRKHTMLCTVSGKVSLELRRNYHEQRIGKRPERLKGEGDGGGGRREERLG